MNIEMSEATRELLGRERLVIADLRTLLGRLDAAPEDLEELKTALHDLEGIFMLVACGEFNAGKSSLLNTLLGERVMPEGVTPTTDRITIVSYGEEAKDVEESGFIVRRQYPADILRDLALVDTPGTNAIIRKHQELTERFIPRSDLVLFVTSADRPFTETERRFLELIGSWGKKIVIVVNKIDILEDEEAKAKVLDFVKEHARETLGVSPQVFGTKAKQAFRALESGDAELLADSGVLELERFIEESLSEGQRLKLKLQNPLGVAHRIAESYREIINTRLDLLEEDRRTLDEVDRQVVQFEKDMQREFEAYLARTKTVLLEVEKRGDIFFDDTIQLRQVFKLINRDKIRQAFESRVIRDADREVDHAVGEMVDWFIQKNLQLWEDVMTFVQQRRKAGEERIIGEVGGRFQYDREALIRTLQQSAEEILEGYDQAEEGRRLAESLQSAVVQTGLLEVGGLGLGAAILAFVSGAAFDITGVMAGLTVAGLGLLVLPRQRRKAKRELHNKMQSLRDGLAESLGTQFSSELLRAAEKLRSAVSPYTRFVRSELGRLESLGSELQATEAELAQLKAEVEALST